jgi:hypothetical protein
MDVTHHIGYRLKDIEKPEELWILGYYTKRECHICENVTTIFEITHDQYYELIKQKVQTE